MQNVRYNLEFRIEVKYYNHALLRKDLYKISIYTRLELAVWWKGKSNFSFTFVKFIDLTIVNFFLDAFFCKFMTFESKSSTCTEENLFNPLRN